MALGEETTPDPKLRSEKDVHQRVSSSGSGTMYEHRDHVGRPGVGGSSNPPPIDTPATDPISASRKLAHPLDGLTPERLGIMGEEYARKAGLTSDEDIRTFRLGAIIAANDCNYNDVKELTEREREVLEREVTHKWSNPPMLYWVVVSEFYLPSLSFSDGTT